MADREPHNNSGGPTLGTVQRFGGSWSLVKIGMLEQYIRYFNTVLKNQPFKRVYIDAFAGSGAFRLNVSPAPLTLFGARDQSDDVHSGSAQLALDAKPPFDEIIFIEGIRTNVESLRARITASGHPCAEVMHGDANSILKDVCRNRDWRNRRGLIFLDPFAMNVEWGTLQAVAATRALDVWFLFALAATVRNLPRLADSLDASKRAAVTRVLGTDKWFSDFYTPPAQEFRSSLFDDLPGTPRLRRTATLNQIEEYMRSRLSELFPHVERPLRLKASGNKSLFSLFFAVSNPSPAAIKAAHKGAAYILGKK